MDSAAPRATARPASSRPLNETGDAEWLPLVGLLACPACRGTLVAAPGALTCTACQARYGVREGVALLAIRGTSETWGQAQQARQSATYQTEYQRVEDAAAYNLAYREKLLKRSSTRREFELIRCHMARVGHSRVILDLPCGGGRLTPAFADHADLVIEADIAPGQVQYGRTESRVSTPRVWMTASAFHVPLRDRAIDGAISVRLSHHLPTAAERERHLEELLRVSRRFVILTFFDHASLKNRLRRLRAPFDGQPPKFTMTTDRVAELARRHGARLLDAPLLSRIGSGHRYALLVKEDARR